MSALGLGCLGLSSGLWMLQYFLIPGIFLHAFPGIAFRASRGAYTRSMAFKFYYLPRFFEVLRVCSEFVCCSVALLPVLFLGGLGFYTQICVAS